MAAKKKNEPSLEADRYEEDVSAWNHNDGGQPNVVGHYSDEHLLVSRNQAELYPSHSSSSQSAQQRYSSPIGSQSVQQHFASLNLMQQPQQQSQPQTQPSQQQQTQSQQSSQQQQQGLHPQFLALQHLPPHQLQQLQNQFQGSQAQQLQLQMQYAQQLQQAHALQQIHAQQMQQLQQNQNQMPHQIHQVMQQPKPPSSQQDAAEQQKQHIIQQQQQFQQQMQQQIQQHQHQMPKFMQLPPEQQKQQLQEYHKQLQHQQRLQQQQQQLQQQNQFIQQQHQMLQQQQLQQLQQQFPQPPQINQPQLQAQQNQQGQQQQQHQNVQQRMQSLPQQQSPPLPQQQAQQAQQPQQPQPQQQQRQIQQPLSQQAQTQQQQQQLQQIQQIQAQQLQQQHLQQLQQKAQLQQIQQQPLQQQHTPPQSHITATEQDKSKAKSKLPPNKRALQKSPKAPKSPILEDKKTKGPFIKMPPSPESPEAFPEIAKAISALRPVILSLDPLLREGIHKTLTRLAEDANKDSLSSSNPPGMNIPNKNDNVVKQPGSRDEAQKSLLERALSYDLLRLMMALDSGSGQITSSGQLTIEPALAVSTDSLESPERMDRMHSFGQDSPDVPESSIDTRDLSTISLVRQNASDIYQQQKLYPHAYPHHMMNPLALTTTSLPQPATDMFTEMSKRQRRNSSPYTEQPHEFPAPPPRSLSTAVYSSEFQHHNPPSISLPPSLSRPGMYPPDPTPPFSLSGLTGHVGPMGHSIGSSYLGSSNLPFLIEENESHSDLSSLPPVSSSSSSSSSISAVPDSLYSSSAPHPPSTTPPTTNANFNPNNFLGNPNYMNMNYMPYLNNGSGNNNNNSNIGFKNRTEDALSSG